MKIINAAIATLTLVASSLGFAGWQLDNDESRLSFTTVKAGHAGEVHTFDTLTGTVDDRGNINITIPLLSVNTGIEIRNDRMQSMLFESDQFPTATLSAAIKPVIIDSLAVGDMARQVVPAKLDLHGEQTTVSLSVAIAKLTDARLLVTSWEPLIINAGDFTLVGGIEKLKTVAGLPAISHAVPVSFVLTLNRQ